MVTLTTILACVLMYIVFNKLQNKMTKKLESSLFKKIAEHQEGINLNQTLYKYLAIIFSMMQLFIVLYLIHYSIADFLDADLRNKFDQFIKPGLSTVLMLVISYEMVTNDLINVALKKR
jgi:hypothetical protein